MDAQTVVAVCSLLSVVIALFSLRTGCEACATAFPHLGQNLAPSASWHPHCWQNIEPSDAIRQSRTQDANLANAPRYAEHCDYLWLPYLD